MIKTLTYISKINKNKKEIKKLFQIPMRNLKISFKEEENSMKYEEYYFNGIPSPIDIQFKDIGINNFKIFWKIEDINILNIDKNKIKYKVEIRKENSNENFSQIYEGNELNCLVDNLNNNTNYEIRICSIYNNIEGIWSEIKRIKTNEFVSLILNESKREDEFIKKILEWSRGKKMELLYRGTRDGMTSNDFHNKCNNKGPILV